jgi:lysophospholipase L1-like esterase
MHQRILFIAACLIVAAALPAAAVAKPAAPRYYLALGDSLAQGMQPDANGVTRDTNEGYADDLLAIERSHVHSLQLVKLGCGGETSTSMITGRGNPDAAVLRCTRAGGSQLAAAVRFLRAHHRRGEVPLITLDIGANDVDGCATSTNVGACVTAGVAAIHRNVPKILKALRAAAPAGTRFAAMTLYDPILGGYFSTDTYERSLALGSPTLLQEVNGELVSADQGAGFRTADVAGAFDSYDSTQTVLWEGQQIPVNVARVCSWTWACQTPPSGPNIHANKNGYVVIARAFAAAIGRL